MWFLCGCAYLLLCVSPSLTDTAGLNDAIDGLLLGANEDLARSNLTVGGICKEIKVRYVYIFKVPAKMSCQSPGAVNLTKLRRHGDVSRSDRAEGIVLEARVKVDTLQLHYSRCDLTTSLWWHHVLPLTAEMRDLSLLLRVVVVPGGLFSSCSSQLTGISLEPVQEVPWIRGHWLDFTRTLQDVLLRKANTELRDLLTHHLTTTLQGLIANNKLCDKV